VLSRAAKHELLTSWLGLSETRSLSRLAPFSKSRQRGCADVDSFCAHRQPIPGVVLCRSLCVPLPTSKVEHGSGFARDITLPHPQVVSPSGSGGPTSVLSLQAQPAQSGK
jgi:hypothetical protein